MALKETEKQIQNAILEYLNFLPQCRAWTNQSQGVYDPSRGVFRRQAGKYTSKGVSDIIGIYRGHMLCIEVKSKTGKVSPHQQDFIDEMASLGAFAIVARSVQEVADQLKVFIRRRQEAPLRDLDHSKRFNIDDIKAAGAFGAE